MSAVWLVTGAQASGKSTVADLLARRFSLGAHVAVASSTAGPSDIYGVDVERWLDRVQTTPKHLVVLRPRVDVIEERDAPRQRTSGKIAYRGAFTPTLNDEHVATTRRDLGLWVDSSSQSPDETVNEILRRAHEAVIS